MSHIKPGRYGRLVVEKDDSEGYQLTAPVSFSPRILDELGTRISDPKNVGSNMWRVPAQREERLREVIYSSSVGGSTEAAWWTRAQAVAIIIGLALIVVTSLGVAYFVTTLLSGKAPSVEVWSVLIMPPLAFLGLLGIMYNFQRRFVNDVGDQLWAATFLTPSCTTEPPSFLRDLMSLKKTT